MSWEKEEAKSRHVDFQVHDNFIIIYLQVSNSLYRLIGNIDAYIF